MSLMADGTILMHEGFMHNDAESGSKTRMSSWHDIEGTCHPEELSYTLWSAMEEHL